MGSVFAPALISLIAVFLTFPAWKQIWKQVSASGAELHAEVQEGHLFLTESPPACFALQGGDPQRTIP